MSNMEFVKFSTCINTKIRIYGLKIIGLVLGVISMIFVWAKTSIIFGIIFGSVGYYIGDICSGYYYEGIIQKLLYWYLSSYIPSLILSLPNASKRALI